MINLPVAASVTNGVHCSCLKHQVCIHTLSATDPDRQALSYQLILHSLPSSCQLKFVSGQSRVKDGKNNLNFLSVVENILHRVY